MGLSNRVNKAELTGYLVSEDLVTSGDLVSENLGTGGLITIGEKGIDGYSPIVTINEVETSEGIILHEINITDIDHPTTGQTFTISNGVGISSAELNSDYTLTLYFNDGTYYTTPSIRGEKGDSGNGIQSIEKTDSYYDSEGRFIEEFTITFTDGNTFVYYIENGLISTNYNILDNKPSINNVELSGDLSLDDLNIQQKLTSENAGEGISITIDSEGNTIISNTNASVEWGNIRGDIKDQTDLMGYIDQHSGKYTAGRGIKITNSQIAIDETLILDCGTSTDVLT